MIDLPTPKIIIKTISMGGHPKPWGAQHKNKKYNSATNSSTVVAKKNSNSMCAADEHWTQLSLPLCMCVCECVSLCVQLSLVSLSVLSTVLISLSLSHFLCFLWGPTLSVCLSVWQTFLPSSPSSKFLLVHTPTDREREEREEKEKKKKNNNKNGIMCEASCLTQWAVKDAENAKLRQIACQGSEIDTYHHYPP